MAGVTRHWVFLVALMQALVSGWAQTHEISFASSVFNALEGSTPVKLEVWRCCGTSFPAATVELVSADGSARAGSDYTAIQETLVFEPGQTRLTVWVTLIDDTLFEGSETFTVALRNPTGGAVIRGNTSTDVVVADDERGFGFVYGGHGNEKGVPLRPGVSRSGTILPPASVELVTVGGTATAGLDFAAQTHILTFQSGQQFQELEIPVVDDGLVEGEETVRFELRNSSGFPIDAEASSMTASIIDNDVGFVLTGPAFGSVDESEPVAQFEVTLVGNFALNTEVSVQVSTQDGTGRAGKDYGAIDQRVVFAPGERVKRVAVPILNNSDIDGGRYFTVRLSQPQGLPIAAQQFQHELSCGINDNETGYSVENAYFLKVLFEGQTNHVRILRNGDFGFPSSVELQLVQRGDDWGLAGTATPGLDYPVSGITIRFEPGETSKEVSLEIPDDGVIEPDESLYLKLVPVGTTVPVSTEATPAAIVEGGTLPSLVDPEFDLPATPITGSTLRWVVLEDGRMIYVADRVGHDGREGSLVLRVLPDGRPDPAWHPVLTDGQVSAIVRAGVDQVLVAQMLYGAVSGSETRLFRCKSDGTPDPSFVAELPAQGDVTSLTADNQGRVLVNAGGVLLRLLPNGRRDVTFQALGPVWEWAKAVLAPDGSMLVTGNGPLIRLSPDGVPDLTFQSPRDPDDLSYHFYDRLMPVGTDGRWLAIAWGPPDRFSGPSYTLMRFRSDGSLDPSFPRLNVGAGEGLARASDGTVWRLRFFTAPDTWILERLNRDGDPDPNWGGQFVRIPVRWGRGGPMDIPELLPVPNTDGSQGPSDLLVLNLHSVNGHARHRAARIHARTALTVIVDPSTARIPESAGNAAVRLHRSGPVTVPLSLDFSTEPITAVPGVDYTPVFGTLTFPAGVRTAAIIVPVLDNKQPDGDRRVRLRFSAATGTEVPPPAGFSIANDDPGFPPHSLRLLADGAILAHPTGWIEGMPLLSVFPLADLGGRTAGLEEFRWNEPFPELRLYGRPWSTLGFFRVAPASPILISR